MINSSSEPCKRSEQGEYRFNAHWTNWQHLNNKEGRTYCWGLFWSCQRAGTQRHFGLFGFQRIAVQKTLGSTLTARGSRPLHQGQLKPWLFWATISPNSMFRFYIYLTFNKDTQSCSIGLLPREPFSFNSLISWKDLEFHNLLEFKLGR